jgi:hypothetical protein
MPQVDIWSCTNISYTGWVRRRVFPFLHQIRMKTNTTKLDCTEFFCITCIWCWCNPSSPLHSGNLWEDRTFSNHEISIFLSSLATSPKKGFGVLGKRTHLPYAFGLRECSVCLISLDKKAHMWTIEDWTVLDLTCQRNILLTNPICTWASFFTPVSSIYFLRWKEQSKYIYWKGGKNYIP